jgi:hypothetical protein
VSQRSFTLAWALVILVITAPFAIAQHKVFLHLDPHQARFEMAVPLSEALQWAGQAAAPDQALPAAELKSLAEKLQAGAANWLRATADGKGFSLELGKVMLLDTSAPGAIPFPLPDDKAAAPKDLQAALTWQGAVFGEFQELTLKSTIPSGFTVVGQSGERTETLPMTTQLKWAVKSMELSAAAPLPVPSPIGAPRLGPTLGGGSWMALSLGIAALVRRYSKRAAGVVFAMLALAGFVMVPKLTRPAMPDAAAMQASLEPLVQNIYEALESPVAEVRQRSLLKLATAEAAQQLESTLRPSLLAPKHTDLFTQVARGQLSLDVESVTLADLLTAEVTWTAIGGINHLGHTDTRINRFRAKLGIARDEQKWKLVTLEVMQHRQM